MGSTHHLQHGAALRHRHERLYEPGSNQQGHEDEPKRHATGYPAGRIS